MKVKLRKAPVSRQWDGGDVWIVEKPGRIVGTFHSDVDDPGQPEDIARYIVADT